MKMSTELLDLVERLKRDYPLVSDNTHRALADRLSEEPGAAVSLVAHPDMRVRLGLVTALGYLHDPPSSQLLGRALHDEMAVVRRTACELVGHRPASEALPALKAALLSSDQGIRESAVAQLPPFGADALPLLTATLKDSHTDVRIATVWALARVEGDASKSLLKTALADEVFTVRAQARLALGHLPTR